jgi:hypothetical protein
MPRSPLNWPLALEYLAAYKAQVVRVWDYPPYALGAEMVLDLCITPLEKRYANGERSPEMFISMLNQNWQRRGGEIPWRRGWME